MHNFLGDAFLTYPITHIPLQASILKLIFRVVYKYQIYHSSQHFFYLSFAAIYISLLIERIRKRWENFNQSC